MSNKQIRAMMRSPKKLMNFHLSGKLPRERPAPTTPLLELILKIPPSMWGQFVGIKVDNRLGFNGSRMFNNLHHVARWIGHNETIIDNGRMPYMSWVNRSFKKTLSLEELMDCCTKAPDLEDNSIRVTLARVLR